jgi:hypothetical protein
MKKIIIIAVLFFSSSDAFSQNGFTCDMSEVDTLLTPTEKCILECIKQLPLEKYLGHQNIGFFDSLINCSYKKVKLVAERQGYYYTTVIFSFTENLKIKFYFKILQYGNKGWYNAKRKWDPKMANKEIPFKLKIFHFITPFCEMGSLEN